MAIPAWNIVGVLAAHLLSAIDGIFKNFIQCVADVEIAICIRRPIVQNKLISALA